MVRSHDREPAYETEVGSDERVSNAILAAVSEATGVDPLELPPLYGCVDTDALDALVGQRGDRRSVDRVSFSFSGCRVTVTGSGTIRISTVGATPADRAAEGE